MRQDRMHMAHATHNDQLSQGKEIKHDLKTHQCSSVGGLHTVFKNTVHFDIPPMITA